MADARRLDQRISKPYLKHPPGAASYYVNEQYDEGQVIFQARCIVDPADEIGRIAEKVHALEYEHYPRIIEMVIKDLK